MLTQPDPYQNATQALEALKTLLQSPDEQLKTESALAQIITNLKNSPNAMRDTTGLKNLLNFLTTSLDDPFYHFTFKELLDSDGFMFSQELLDIITTDKTLIQTILIALTEKNDWGFLSGLLSVDEIRNETHFNENLLLRTVLSKHPRNWSFICQLLYTADYATTQALKQITLEDAEALLSAAGDDQEWDIINSLLSNKAILVLKNSIKLPSALMVNAANENQWNTVQLLLDFPAVQNDANTENNYTLCIAINFHQSTIVEKLLTFRAVRNNITLPQLFTLDAKNIPEDIFHKLLSLAKLYGIPIKNIFNKDFYEQLKKEPRKFFSKLPSLDTYQWILDSKIAMIGAQQALGWPELMEGWKLDIIDILFTEQEMKNKKKAWLENSETAQSAIVLNAAELAYKTAQQRYGEVSDTDLLGIEEQIRETLLNDILTENNLSALALNFIKTHFNELKKGQNKDLMDQLRTHLDSNTNILHVAWRAYDRFSLVLGNWPNLLIPNGSNEVVYAAGIESDAINESKIPLNIASDDVRKRVAIYFKALSDPNNTHNFETRKALFFGQIADIQRAHNHLHENNDIDDPSCYPGTIGRILEMGSGNPNLDIPDTEKLISELAGEVLAETVNEQIAQLMKDPGNNPDPTTTQQTAIEIEKLALALTFFPYEAREALIARKHQVMLPITQVLVSIESLHEKYLEILNSDILDSNAQNIVDILKKKLKSRDFPNKKEFHPDELFYCYAQWLYFNRNGMASKVISRLGLYDKVNKLYQGFENQTKASIFNKFYLVFLDALKKDTEPAVVEYLLTKAIENIETLPDPTNTDFTFSVEDIAFAYKTYLKTGHSHSVSFLEKAENHPKLTKATETTRQEFYKDWNTLTLEAKEREKTKKLNLIPDAPYQTPKHLLKRNPHYGEKLNKTFRLLYEKIEPLLQTELNGTLKPFEIENISKFLAMQYLDESNATPEGNPEVMLQKAYAAFKNTDAFVEIPCLTSPAPLKSLATALSAILEMPEGTLLHAYGPRVEGGGTKTAPETKQPNPKT